MANKMSVTKNESAVMDKKTPNNELDWEIKKIHTVDAVSVGVATLRDIIMARDFMVGTLPPDMELESKRAERCFMDILGESEFITLKKILNNALALPFNPKSSYNTRKVLKYMAPQNLFNKCTENEIDNLMKSIDRNIFAKNLDNKNIADIYRNRRDKDLLDSIAEACLLRLQSSGIQSEQLLKYSNDFNITNRKVMRSKLNIRPEDLEYAIILNMIKSGREYNLMIMSKQLEYINKKPDSKMSAEEIFLRLMGKTPDDSGSNEIADKTIKTCNMALYNKERCITIITKQSSEVIDCYCDCVQANIFQSLLNRGMDPLDLSKPEISIVNTFTGNKYLYSNTSECNEKLEEIKEKTGEIELKEGDTIKINFNKGLSTSDGDVTVDEQLTNDRVIIVNTDYIGNIDSIEVRQLRKLDKASDNMKYIDDIIERYFDYLSITVDIRMV